MHEFNELYRQRMAGQIDDMTLPPDSGEQGAVSMTVITTTVMTYPTVARSWYAVQVTEVTGDETEGGTVSTSTPAGTAFYALNLGAAIPPANTPIVITQLDGIWVFTFN